MSCDRRTFRLTIISRSLRASWHGGPSRTGGLTSMLTSARPMALPHVQFADDGPVGLLNILIRNTDWLTVGSNVRCNMPVYCLVMQCRRITASVSRLVSLLGVYTIRSSDRPVGPTGLSDWSVRRSYRVNASSDRSDRRSGV